ncbi:alpha/beta hydrolase [Actinoplanes sp. NPDC089786]|uniref:alpha/beta fold hydrolase n=1 Tax=Actinoplanes sp. NPDC089786 TaxID=3155185 RepID=UPI00341BAC3D
MPFVESNGISLCYEAIGDAADPVMLLIMGVGEQLIAWPDGFCEILAGHGFRVIRFDNRDVGWSDWFDEAGDVDLAGLAAGDLSTVVGVSMGGGIAQQMAIENPELVAKPCVDHGDHERWQGRRELHQSRLSGQLERPR